MINTQQYDSKAMRPAFTLLEILVVIAIIAVLASLTFGGMSYYSEKMKYSRTQVLIASIESALEQYKADNGFYPQGDGNANSSVQLYIALYGDGKLKMNPSGLISIVEEPDGDNQDPTDGESYLATLNPEFKGKQGNVGSPSSNYTYIDPETGEEITFPLYVIIDSWNEELRYRHNSADPSVVNNMMNPKNDYDISSKGANGNGHPDETTEADIADDIKNW
jgi:prepilin-type N-terminal cleavage/methylation domain-containing protein